MKLLTGLPIKAIGLTEHTHFRLPQTARSLVRLGIDFFFFPWHISTTPLLVIRMVRHVTRICQITKVYSAQGSMMPECLISA